MCVCLSVRLYVHPHRVGAFAFPAVWVESLLFVGEGFGLKGEHPPLLTPHFLPVLTEEHTDGPATHTPTDTQINECVR